MKNRIIKAEILLRKLRGGSQAHLLKAADGHFYAVKCRNNPQHRRVLINELICSILLDYLDISAAAGALVQISPEFLRANPEAHLMTRGQRVAVEPGWHFGSRYPVDPSATALYDFLPDSILPRVVNLDQFRAILVFDKWVGNTDARQAVFYRASIRRKQGTDNNNEVGFVACMIDHGFAFDGPNWKFVESAPQGLYPRKIVYEGVCSLESFQPWLTLIENFPEEVIDRAWKSIPYEWFEDDQDALLDLLGQLFRRRGRVAALLSACWEGLAAVADRKKA